MIPKPMPVVRLLFRGAETLPGVESKRAEIEAQHESNLIAIKHNAAARNAVLAALRDAGISPTRARSQGRVVGIAADLERAYPTEDGYSSVVSDLDRAKRYIEEKSRLKKIETDKEQRARERMVRLAKLIVRYGLPEDSDWDDVAEELRSRDKYLGLGIAGERTRGDWSDGYYRVRNALQGFVAESDQDREIKAELWDLVSDDGDRDGRVFRDCVWNYDRLFALVPDQQLVKDAREAAYEAEAS